MKRMINCLTNVYDKKLFIPDNNVKQKHGKMEMSSAINVSIYIYSFLHIFILNNRIPFYFRNCSKIR